MTTTLVSNPCNYARRSLAFFNLSRRVDHSLPKVREQTSKVALREHQLPASFLPASFLTSNGPGLSVTIHLEIRNSNNPQHLVVRKDVG